jgi:hypothetical protein
MANCMGSIYQLNSILFLLRLELAYCPGNFGLALKYYHYYLAKLNFLMFEHQIAEVVHIL